MTVKGDQMSMPSNGDTQFILGLDLGVASIGWSLVGLDSQGKPNRILRTGAHVFEPGVSGTASEIASGRDETKAAKRREARQTRRGYWRRKRRRRHILRVLQKYDLLPEFDTNDSSAIDVAMKTLDGVLRESWHGDTHQDQLNMPYRLRAAALSRRLEPFELGRAIYHLAQRRGFLSNRRVQREDEDEGVVKKGISDLQHAIDESGLQTVGAYLASLNPDETRLRGRWTSRAMYEHEFSRIWDTQAQHHVQFTDEAREALHEAVFHQRPLRNQRYLAGTCSLLPDERRASLSLRVAQRVRMLQRLNDLRIAEPGQPFRVLTVTERDCLLYLLSKGGDLRYTTMRTKKVLGLPKGTVFNFEDGGETSQIGHRTDASIRGVFGSRYDKLTDSDKDQVVEDLRSIRLPSALAKRGQSQWKLGPDEAIAFANLHLEEGYASHSVNALEQLLPHLEVGLSYAEAKQLAFPESHKATAPRDALPPILDCLDDIRNPTVQRVLTELRKIVNEIIRHHGKPNRVHVELARDIKKPRAARMKETARNRKREKERAGLAERITQEVGIYGPSRADIEKVMLAEECGWQCPYTGRHFGMADLLGPEPQYDIEHIWPFSQSLDNSFLNKTICYHEENRVRKGNHTPFGAYSATPEVYGEILQRVKGFRGDPGMRAEKLRRFLSEDIPEGFTTRHLNDTRYASRLAAEYLGLLFGGISDESGTQRVFTGTGGLTAWLRRGWGLERVLSSEGKNRLDHRHHAVDATVIAIAGPAQVQSLTRAAQRADGRRLFGELEEPWEGIAENLAEKLDEVVISHRQNRRLSGVFHAESNYSRPIGSSDEHRIRKLLWKLTAAEIKGDAIVDARARQLIQDKLAALGGLPPNRAFKDDANLPTYHNRMGQTIRIRKVRVRVASSPKPIGRPESLRWVLPAPGTIHHMAIYGHADGKGWISEAVPLLEATERLRRGEPVVDRSERGGKPFLFSLAPNEFVQMEDDKNVGVYRVLGLSVSGLVDLVSHSDARPRHDGTKASLDPLVARLRLQPSVSVMGKRSARKVSVTHLGEIRHAGG